MDSMDIYECIGEYEFDRDNLDYYVSLNPHNGKLGGFISKFEGCCGYAILQSIHDGNIEVNTKLVREILLANQEDEFGFGAVQATVTEDELADQMKELGWTELFRHLNYGTYNTIITLVYKL